MNIDNSLPKQDILDSLTPEELDHRLALIKTTEIVNGNWIRHSNSISDCAHCGKALWIGRCPLGLGRGYLFPDYRWIIVRNQHEPLCKECGNKCHCTDSNYRLETSHCQVCNGRICDTHNGMANNWSCNRCYKRITTGLNLVDILTTKRPATFDELYSYLDDK